VHGCFWHRHENCSRATTPKSNTEFWLAKFAKNIARDKENISELRTLGWNVIVIWECELMKYPEKVLAKTTEKLTEYAQKSEIKHSVSYSCDAPANIPYAAESSAEYGRKKT
jgi:DNA mismatch endonuclease (patch repair protein)